ncbi:hypothetical protein TIFTF001_027305 [Ficus carica]|uniref:Epidermal patterning factor-like protein n=1 Tax=Ficus carica TaxID=3494 RepID=A0AA88DMQ0_FICCA|nr:hypothetical protein TIFTF001_027305 [Ficus carica]
MASSSAVKHLNRPKIAVTLIFILSITLFFRSSSAETAVPGEYHEELGEMKMVLGSKPPQCANKCMSCRPCMAALVIPQHQKNGAKASSPHEHDQSYYLLAWKCKCRDKFFQP